MKKTYLVFNWVIIGFFLYFLSLPLISPVLGRYLPNLWSCAYHRYTNTECIFCGITRDLNTTFSGNDAVLLNPLSKYLIIYSITIIFIRFLLLLFFKKFSDRSFKWIIIIDLFIHIILIIGLVYIILST